MRPAYANPEDVAMIASLNSAPVVPPKTHRRGSPGTTRPLEAATRIDFGRALRIGVLRVPAEDFGSLSFDRLAGFERELFRLARRFPCASWIIDLSGIQVAGAALLGTLVRCGRAVSVTGARLVVCGDRGGLLHASRLNRTIGSFENVAEAMEYLESDDVTSERSA